MTEDKAVPVEVIANIFGLTPRRVQQLANDGVIPRAERGRYNLLSAVRGYIKFLKDRAIGAAVEGDDPNGHKRRLLKARADIAEMEAEQIAGTLGEVRVMGDALEAAIVRAQAKILALPSKLAPIVAVETSVDKSFSLIQAAVHEVLAELAADPDFGNPRPDVGGNSAPVGLVEAAEPDDIGMGRPVPPPVKRGKRRARPVDHGEG